jgi:hypothetical protein
MIATYQIQIAALGLLVIALTAMLTRVYVRLRKIRAHYRVIDDAEKEAGCLREDARRSAEELKEEAKTTCDRLRLEANEQAQRRDSLSTEVAAIQETHSRLQNEIAAFEENLEDISFGLYKPHFDYETSEEYKTALEDVIAKQREMIHLGKAANFAVQWTVGGSRKEGERMQRQYAKLLLRAFNGEAEAAVAKAVWNNVVIMTHRIEKSFAAINELGSVMRVSVEPAYKSLKLNELRLEYELAQKQHEVLEAQRKAREQMHEQERQQRELEAAAKQAEEEEGHYTEFLEKARLAVAKAEGEEHARLTKRVLELEEQLTEARKKKERARALAELTRAGYVYVLSNIGSFGERVFKIGMTRRVDPMDRVRELGDASVPFKFDVHAMVYSEDAVAIEDAFHERFADRNVNLMNLRKEFFRVSLDELQAFAKERGLKIAFAQIPEAREYRETLAHRRGSSDEATRREENRKIASPRPPVRAVSAEL